MIVINKLCKNVKTLGEKVRECIAQKVVFSDLEMSSTTGFYSQLAIITRPSYSRPHYWFFRARLSVRKSVCLKYIIAQSKLKSGTHNCK